MAGDSIRQAGQQPINIKDEGISLVVNPSSLDFVGSGITGTVSGADVTETVAGGGMGTVTSVSSTNSYIGVANPTTTPALTFDDTGLEKTSNKATNFSTVNDTLYPSVQATKTYADGLVAGLLDYRGAYDASVNTWPVSGGSGTAGAVLKGDMWVVSVQGTLGGSVVHVGDSIIANVDTPGQTTGNWNTLNTNISYVPEDQANKVTSISGASTDTQYPSAKLLYDQLLAKSDLRMYATTGGSVDAVTATFSPVISSLADKTAVIIRSVGQNLTTTPTFAPDGLTARTITHFGGVALHPNDMGPAGHYCILIYDLSNTRWELINPVQTLDGLTDVTLSSPAVDQFLRYNGSQWTNATIPTGSVGNGVTFYNSSPTITATGTNNAIPIFTLSATPTVTAEQTVTGTSSGGVTTTMCAWLNGVLGRTTIDAGIWEFETYCHVDSATGTSTLTRQIYSVLPQDGGSITVTTTGAGTSRTMTASGGTPFATTKIDASATNTDASFVSTPQGLYQITARTSDTVVTIAVPTTYANETGVAMQVWKKLFGSTTDEINSTVVTGTTFQSTQGAFTITANHKLGAISFFTSTSVGTRTLTIYYDGTTHNTHFHTPLVPLHKDLAGLQGGSANEYYHLTSSEYTGTGSGVFARSTSPTFTTSISTPSIVSTGAIGITPNAGSNLNVSLSTTGDFAVNTNQLYVDTSAGNVGIGTTTPSQKLTVYDASQAQMALEVPGAGDQWNLISDSAGKFRVYSNDTASTRLTIDTAGNVGIGTTSPGSKLEVSGATTTTTIELGHATDTTLSRVSAGVVAIEGVNIVTTSSTDTLSNKVLDTSCRQQGTPINAQTGTSYTLVLTDAGKVVTLNNASAITLTIPTNASVAFPTGTRIDLIQLGAGKVTVGGASVTINSKSSNKSIGAQYVGVTLVKYDTDTWALVGDLIA